MALRPHRRADWELVQPVESAAAAAAPAQSLKGRSAAMRSSRQSESKQQKQQHCELYSSFDFLTNHLAVDDYSYDVCRQPLLTQLDLLFRECARQLRSV